MGLRWPKVRSMTQYISISMQIMKKLHAVRQMRMVNSLNVPSFKSVLSDWVKNHPDTLFDDREKSEPVYDAMLFIKDWQLLLLSEDKELRDLYLEYMKKYSACYCARMTMDR